MSAVVVPQSPTVNVADAAEHPKVKTALLTHALEGPVQVVGTSEVSAEAFRSPQVLAFELEQFAQAESLHAGAMKEGRR